MPTFKMSEDRSRGELEVRCRNNWDEIPAETRRKLIEHLHRAVPKTIQQKWRDQHNKGHRIGSDTPFFHMFDGGMAIRNLLREVLPDDQLPLAKQRSVDRNWDDFYTGALEELVETEWPQEVLPEAELDLKEELNDEANESGLHRDTAGADRPTKTGNPENPTDTQAG